MATIHLPGTGWGAADGGRRRRLAVAAGVALVVAVIAIPFALRGLDHDHSATTSTTRVATGTSSPPTTPNRSQHHQSTTDPALGSQADLPALLPLAAAAPLQDGQAVRVGDLTEGTLRHAPGEGWRVMVRWADRLQPLATRGPVSLGVGAWVAQSGMLYTRVPTGTPGRYDVYAWQPQNVSAYVAPTLVATSLGTVCFNTSFTAYGACR
ncbi:MAG: hypothetical protein QM747_21900 [Nocardioides sp.]